VSPASYNTALAIYFVGYVIFEIPANVCTTNSDPPLQLTSFFLDNVTLIPINAGLECILTCYHPCVD